MAGAAPAAVPAGPGRVLDDLTPAVVAAREKVAKAKRPPVFERRLAAEAEQEHWGLFASACAGNAARLVIVTHAKYAQHPLLAEAIDLRAELTRLFESAHARHSELRRGAIRLNLR